MHICAKFLPYIFLWRTRSKKEMIE
jgi:hypothetical protein